jgi:hypothetical protein
VTARWLVPLLLVAAFLVGAAGALAVESGVFRSATPTPTLLPTVTPRPQPTATARVIYITATPSASATYVPSPTQTSAATATTSSDPAKTDLTIIRSHGYSPQGSGASTSDGSGGTLYAWPAICTGSADGYCQKVFFFIDTRYLGTDTAHASNAITKVQATGPQDIAVTYPSYAAQDPLCCPSGKPVTITYHWTGNKLVPSGTPPGH